MMQTIAPPLAVLPNGLMQSMRAAGFSVSFSPDGWLVSDAAGVTAFAQGYSGSAAELAFNRNAKLSELSAAYAAKQSAGRRYVDGKTYQIDATSQANMTAMAVRAGLVLSNATNSVKWPSGFYWIAGDNSHTPMTAQQMYDFAQNVCDYISAMTLHNRSLKDSINSATTVSDLAAIDITQGWPE